ncbi:MAG: hypothetical protein Q8N77_00085, partial [Nanoarchaeota archaeon]|nr:hypothetical protein [Nanoarchaeota archaeon]
KLFKIIKMLRKNLSEMDEVPEDVEKLYQKVLFDNPDLKKRIELKKIDTEVKRQEYCQRPEVKARLKEYLKEYAQRPEVKVKRRAYIREYYQRPEVKAKRREYYSKPDINKKIRERQREYYHRPEVKAKMKEYNQKHYQRKQKGLT